MIIFTPKALESNYSNGFHSAALKNKEFEIKIYRKQVYKQVYTHKVVEQNISHTQLTMWYNSSLKA